MSFKRTIAEVRVGEKIESPKNGNGMIISKTKRTITVLFEKGLKVKNTYRHSDAYFWESDF